MVDTFEPDLSDELQEEEEKIVPTLTMWPYAGSLPFEPRVLSFQQDNPFLIGRSDTLPPAEDNAMFKYLNVSRTHGSLYFESGKFWVKDKGSSNGTFLNNERLGKMERKLEHGDILRLGTIGPDTKCVIALVHLCYPSTEKTLSMDSLIDQLEREENLTPYMQAQLKGLKEAKEDRDLLKVTTKEALALNPSLFDFPESQEM